MANQNPKFDDDFRSAVGRSMRSSLSGLLKLWEAEHKDETNLALGHASTGEDFFDSRSSADLSAHRGRSIGNANCILSRTVGFVGLVRRSVSEFILIVHRSAWNSLTKPKDGESSWTLFLLKLTAT